MNRLTLSRHYIQTAPGTERNRKPSNGDVVNAVDVVIWTEPGGVCVNSLITMPMYNILTAHLVQIVETRTVWPVTSSCRSSYTLDKGGSSIDALRWWGSLFCNKIGRGSVTVPPLFYARGYSRRHPVWSAWKESNDNHNNNNNNKRMKEQGQRVDILQGTSQSNIKITRFSPSSNARR